MGQISKVKAVEPNAFSVNIVHKFEEMFLKDTIPNEVGYSIENIAKMFESFEELNLYLDRDKVVEKV